MDPIHQLTYEFCVEHGRPYFGEYAFAFPGYPARDQYLLGLASQARAQRPGQPLRILEIGSWVGSSALTWAWAIRTLNQDNGSLICIDAWRPYDDIMHLDTMRDALGSELSFQLYLHNMRCGGVSHVVHPFRGESDTLLPLLKEASFDLVYVDGSHLYDQVKKDLENAAPLVRPGGLLCGDDLNLQYGDVDRAACDRDGNKQLAEDPKTRTMHHPGVTRAVWERFGRVSMLETVWAVRKGSREGEWISVENCPIQDQLISQQPHVIGSLAAFASEIESYARAKAAASRR